MLQKNYYTLKDIKDLTGCSHRQLQYWEQKGYINPKLGARNVRYYRKEDVGVIEKLMEAKKSGKTLGEAWGENRMSITVKNPAILSLDYQTLTRINQLTSEWVAANNHLLEQLLETTEIEKNMPGYPYSLYNTENVEKLKEHFEQIKKAIRKRDTISDNLRKYFKETNPAQQLIELAPEEMSINTLNALVLYWAKCRKGNYSNKELIQIRESFTDRLRRGESFPYIIMAIKMLSSLS